jgi:hypothetical protein
MVTLTPVGPTTSSSSAVELTPPPGATTGAPPRPDTAGSMPTGSGGQALEPNPRASSQSMQPPPRADVTTLAQLLTQNPPPTTSAPATSSTAAVAQAAPIQRTDPVTALEGVLAAPPADPARLAQLKTDYGATREDMTRFLGRFEAALVPSASAGAQLADLNDHSHVLKLTAHGPHGMTVAERLPVISQTLPGEAEPRFFVKGYGDRLIKLADLEALEGTGMLAHRPPRGGAEPDLEAGSPRADRPSLPRGDMETSLRSSIKQLSMDSALHARRSLAESDDPIMQMPPNPSAMPKEAQWWSSPETATLPGFGPTLANGLTALTPHFYKSERLFLITAMEGYEEFQGRPTPPSDRPPALRAQTAGDLEHPPSAVNVGGPVLAKIRGVKQWEVVGPAELTGVKSAKGARAFEALMDTLREQLGQARAEGASAKPVVIRFTTDDQAVHELTASTQGARLRLVNPTPSLGHGDSAGMMQAGHGAAADIDLYSYEGQYNGLHASKSGTPEPALVLSTGEALPAGPLIKGAGPLVPTVLKRTLHAASRLATSQPAFGLGNQRPLDYTINTAVKVAAKTGVVYGFNMLGRMASAGIGVAGLSSQGGGNIGFDGLAKAVGCMVAAQEATTFAMAQFGKMMPAHFQWPEGRMGRFAVRAMLPSAEEMLRLSLNMKLQQAFGLHRGNAVDVMALASASVAKGGVEWMKSRAGDPANHAAAHLSLTLLYNTIYNVARGVSNAFTLPGGDGHPSARTVGATLAARAIGRLDTMYEPMLTTMLNSAGLVGDNASAYDHQMSRETRGMGDPISIIDRAITDVSNAATGLAGRKLEENRTAMMMLLNVREGMEGVRQYLSRFPLEHEAGRFSEIGAELAAVHASIQHASQPLHPEREKEMDLRLQEKLDALIEAADGGPAADEAQDRPEALRYDVALLDAKDRETFERQSRAAREQWSSRGSLPQTSQFHEIVNDYSNRGRPVDARPGLLLDSAEVPRNVTTWTRRGQAAAWPTTQLMAGAPGIHTPRTDTGLPPVSELLQKRATNSAFLYTVESGMFHLPLRFDYVGQLQYQPIRPKSAISVPHMVLTASAHKPDGGEGLVDPSAILDVNLAARYAPKFPANLDRAAVTEASYIAPGGQTRFGQPVEPGKAPNKAVTEGEVVALTEMYSATTSSRMAAYFGAGINAGATRDRSLRIHAKLLSGVNFAKVSDLAQGEVVAVPGVLMRVRKIDADAGKGPAVNAPGKDVQDLGQVVYFEQVNTYELEQRFQAKKAQPSVDLREGEEAMEPRSGHLLKATRHPAPDAWVFDLGEDRFRRLDSVKDAGRQVLEWSNNKSYFLGRGLEDMDRAGEQGPPERARWLHPYSGDQSMRAIKEATHALILGKDPLVSEGLLDLATENVHHAHFREAGGYAATDAARKAAAQRQAIREQAGAVADAIGEKSLSSPLSTQDAASFSWLMTSLLRKRIELVVLDAAGQAEHTPFDMTYDKIDLKREAALSDLSDKRHEPAHVIVVSPDGVFTPQVRGGRREMVRMDEAGDGPTLGGLVHALVRQAYPEAGHYAEDAVGGLRPDKAAQRSAQDILDTMKDAARADYRPLQEALVKQFGVPQAAAEAPR